MNRTVGLTLRRTAGGGIIFAIGLGVLSTRPQAAMPVLGSTTPLPTEHVMTYYERPIPTPSPEPPAAYPQASQPAAAAIVVKSVAKAAPRVAKPVRVPVLARATPAPARPAAPAAQPVNAAPSGANAFSYGYCTWWVAHKRAIPWRGDAAAWWWNARALGFAEGSTPRVGAVMVMGAGGAASSSGHVGYVEAVNPDGSFVVSEMNWWGVPGGGWGRVDYRTVRSMRGILGFIY